MTWVRLALVLFVVAWLFDVLGLQAVPLWLAFVIAGLSLGWAWFALCAIAFGGRILRFGAAAETAARVADATEAVEGGADGSAGNGGGRIRTSVG